MIMFTDNSLPSLEEGSYSAVLNGVIWLGLQNQDKRDADKYGAKAPTYRLKLLFELPGRTNKFGEVEIVGKAIKNVTTHTKGAFLGIASSLIGKKLQSAELAKYLKNTKDPFKELLGKQFTISIVHFNTEDGIRSYIESIQPPHPKDDRVEGTRDTTYFDPSSGDDKIFRGLTFRTKKDIMSSPESSKYSDGIQKEWVAAQEEQAQKEAEKKESNNGKDYGALA